MKTNYFDDIEFACILNSNRNHLAFELINSNANINFIWDQNNNADSFSKLINSSIKSGLPEYCIFCSDKARPKSKRDFYKIIQLLKLGYGLAGTYGLGFFGVNLEIFRRIGFFDEFFPRGGSEDLDFLNRLIENDIAYYYDIEIPYLNISSSWQVGDSNASLLKQKWREAPLLTNWPEDNFFSIKRNLQDQTIYDGRLGESKPVIFLDNSFTIHPN